MFFLNLLTPFKHNLKFLRCCCRTSFSLPLRYGDLNNIPSETTQ